MNNVCQDTKTSAARDAGQPNIIREEGTLSIEFRKHTGEYLVHEKGAGVCTFIALSHAVEYFNERSEIITAASAPKTIKFGQFEGFKDDATLESWVSHFNFAGDND